MWIDRPRFLTASQIGHDEIKNSFCLATVKNKQMDLEEFCIQAAGRVKGRLTFQGQVVRLDPQMSVCRQLHHRWLSATGREVSYEEFKRSLRFRMQNGEVAVRMAYDPTKLLVAGLAGVGATAAAFGGYQWWKARKSGDAKQAAMQCVEPDYSKWENANPPGAPNNLNFNITDTRTHTYSDEPIRRLCLDETLIEDGTELQEIEKKYNEYATNKQPHELIDGVRLTYKDGVIQAASADDRSLTRPKYFSFEEFTPNVTASNVYRDTRATSMLGYLNGNLPIGEQVNQIIQQGVTWVKDNSIRTQRRQLFNCKKQVTLQYEVPTVNQAIRVSFKNPSNIKNTAFEFTPVITVDGVKYNLELVEFENFQKAILHKGHWVIGNLPSEVDMYKKIPNDDLSIVCAIPTEVMYVKEGFHIVG